MQSTYKEGGLSTNKGDARPWIQVGGIEHGLCDRCAEKRGLDRETATNLRAISWPGDWKLSPSLRGQETPSVSLVYNPKTCEFINVNKLI